MRRHLAILGVLWFGAIFFSVSFILVAEPQRTNTVFFVHDKDNFSATGNWIPADPKGKPAFPSETQIDCFRSNMTCVEAIAEFYMGHPHVMLNYLQVIKWDTDGIVARDSSKICM